MSQEKPKCPFCNGTDLEVNCSENNPSPNSHTIYVECISCGATGPREVTREAAICRFTKTAVLVVADYESACLPRTSLTDYARKHFQPKTRMIFIDPLFNPKFGQGSVSYAENSAEPVEGDWPVPLWSFRRSSGQRDQDLVQANGVEEVTAFIRHWFETSRIPKEYVRTPLKNTETGRIVYAWCLRSKDIVG